MTFSPRCATVVMLEELLGLWIYLINVEAESKAEMYSVFVADLI